VSGFQRNLIKTSAFVRIEKAFGALQEFFAYVHTSAVWSYDLCFQKAQGTRLRAQGERQESN
jgi:hypothetical protein